MFAPVVKKQNCIWLLLVSAALAVAQSPVPDAPPQLSRLPLWKIKGEQNTVYILGSVHILKKENYPLAEPIETSFAESRTVMFETDLDKMQRREQQAKLAELALLPEGKTLRDVLTPETHNRLVEEIRETGLPDDILDRTRPYVAVMTLQIFALKTLGLDPKHGLDRYFLDRARSQGKTVLTLEPVGFQYDLITRFTDEEGEQLMRVALEDIDDLRRLFGDLLRAWETGDVGRLEELLHHSMRGSPQIFKRLVTDRNRQWIPRIQELMKHPENVMVIVGAGHLVGKEGLIELLRAQGVDAEQMFAPR